MAQEQQSERLQLGEISILTAGVPCQPASVAGNQRGTDDARWLWPETFAVIHATYPTWVLLENVPGLLALEQEVAFEHLCLTLESFGYEVQPIVIPACAVDARHRRDRVWIVAHRDNAGLERGIQRKESARKTEMASAGCGKNVADAEGFRGNGNFTATIQGEQPRQMHAESINAPSAFCEWRDEGEWFAESGMGRVAHGIPHRAHRLRGLGNAIVPQVAEEIIRAIANLR